MISKKILQLLNDYSVPYSDKNACEIAKELKISHTGGVWAYVKQPSRTIDGLGQMSDLFKKFTKEYNKHYRTDRSIKFFYALSDEEIREMFDELPFFNKAFEGKTNFKPIVENFLSEKIWRDEYPGKIKRERPKLVRVHDFENWDSYLDALDEEKRDAISIFKDMGMSFDNYKKQAQ